MAGQKNHTVDLTTSIGVMSFPLVFKNTARKRDDGKLSYEVQLLIPKKDKAGARAILAAIKEVGEAKWGAKWKQVRNPLRDGDREADELTEDGSTKGEKYPERLGHYFINARSTRPVGVVDRERTPITEEDEIYSGCRGRLSVSFYPYSNNGNHGVGVGLNGVQKVADGEPLGGGGKPSIESMFDILDDEDDLDLDEEPVAKKATKPAKKTAKKTAKSKVVDLDDDDLDDDDLDDDEDD